jgi:hypothetical protein
MIMKMSKVFALIAVAALIGTSSIAVYASAFGASNNIPVGQTEIITAVPIEINPNMDDRLANDTVDGTIPEELLEMFSRFKNGEIPNMTDEQRTEMQSRLNEFMERFSADGSITQEQFEEIINSFSNGEIPKFGNRWFGRSFNGETPNLTDEQRAEMQSRLHGIINGF